jgi:Transposase DDE domain
MLHFFLSEGMTMRSQAKWLGSKLRDIQRFIEDLFEGDLHAKRVYSLANATLGVMTSASLAVSVIGQALAQARGLLTKHAVKQVDRLLSNPGVVVWDCFAYWVPQVVGARKAIVVAMDWTDFEGDKQTTLVLSLVTRHGRATPLLWLTVDKATLKDRRNEYEDRCLSRFAEVLPAGTEVTILADRGFGDQKLFAFLTALGFAYVIRFRGNITVTDAQGKSRSAADWVGVGGRAHTLRGAKVTADEYPVGTVVCVHAKAMKEPWCLAASDPQGQTRTLINYYGKRWAIESSFRDTKDLRFGMGLGALHIASPERRDRLLLINAFAIVLLTLLGAAGESLGMDRHLKANTVKRRTHSLFRQGCMLYDLIPTMLEERLRPLIERFSQLLLQHRAFSETFCVV